MIRILTAIHNSKLSQNNSSLRIKEEAKRDTKRKQKRKQEIINLIKVTFN